MNIANVTDPGGELRMITSYEELINNQNKRVIVYVARQGEIHKNVRQRKLFQKCKRKSINSTF